MRLENSIARARTRAFVKWEPGRLETEQKITVWPTLDRFVDNRRLWEEHDVAYIATSQCRQDASHRRVAATIQSEKTRGTTNQMLTFFSFPYNKHQM